MMLWIFYKNLKNKLSSKNVTNVIFITWKTITFGTYVHVFIMINYNCNCAKRCTSEKSNVCLSG